MSIPDRIDQDSHSGRANYGRTSSKRDIHYLITINSNTTCTGAFRVQDARWPGMNRKCPACPSEQIQVTTTRKRAREAQLTVFAPLGYEQCKYSDTTLGADQQARPGCALIAHVWERAAIRQPCYDDGSSDQDVRDARLTSYTPPVSQLASGARGQTGCGFGPSTRARYVRGRARR